MPRRGRCVLSEVPCHITQRGVNRCETFSTDDDRQTYLRLLRDNLGDAEVRLLAWCVMGNHVHLIAVPGREDSLGVLFRRVHGRYAQYYNARRGRTGGKRGEVKGGQPELRDFLLGASIESRDAAKGSMCFV